MFSLQINFKIFEILFKIKTFVESQRVTSTKLLLLLSLLLQCDILCHAYAWSPAVDLLLIRLGRISSTWHSDSSLAGWKPKCLFAATTRQRSRHNFYSAWNINSVNWTEPSTGTDRARIASRRHCVTRHSCNRCSIKCLYCCYIINQSINQLVS